MPYGVKRKHVSQVVDQAKRERDSPNEPEPRPKAASTTTHYLTMQTTTHILYDACVQ